MPQQTTSVRKVNLELICVYYQKIELCDLLKFKLIFYNLKPN